MSRLFISVGFTFAISLASLEASSTCQSKLQIANIEPGASQAKVFQFLGRPKTTHRRVGFIENVLVYDELQIGLDEDGLVAYVKSSSEAYCLTGKICPGMLLSDIENSSLKFDRKEVQGKIVMTTYGDSCWG